MASHRSQVLYDGSTKSSWAYGLTILGGVMLCMVAVFQILEGIVGLARDDIYVRGLDYTFQFDVTTWGGIHLVVGLVALGAGIGILLGETWGYVLGIVIAVLSALANFAFVPVFPLWSAIVIGFDIVIIWALSHQLRRPSS
jgi:hypothetical protein